MAEAQVSNAFTVTVDGKPMPADLVPLMVSAVVDDSLNLPDLVILRFRDPDRTGRHAARDQAADQAARHVAAADECDGRLRHCSKPVFDGRAPNSAVPTRTMVAPSSIAIG